MTRGRKKRLTGLKTALYNIYSQFIYIIFIFSKFSFFKLKENLSVCECYNVCVYFVGLNVLYVYEYILQARILSK